MLMAIGHYIQKTQNCTVVLVTEAVGDVDFWTCVDLWTCGMLTFSSLWQNGSDESQILNLKRQKALIFTTLKRSKLKCVKLSNSTAACYPLNHADLSSSHRVIPYHTGSYQLIQDHKWSQQIIKDHKRSYLIIINHNKSKPVKLGQGHNQL